MLDKNFKIVEQNPDDYNNLPSMRSSVINKIDQSSLMVKQTPAVVKKLDITPKNDASNLILHSDEQSFRGDDSYRIEIGGKKVLKGDNASKLEESKQE